MLGCLVGVEFVGVLVWFEGWCVDLVGGLVCWFGWKVGVLVWLEGWCVALVGGLV